MYEKRYMKYFLEHSSTKNWTWKSRWQSPSKYMVQALTWHPFTQKLNKYCIFNCKKLVYLLSKANGVYRVESLIFQKNILMSWLIDENKMANELRLSKTTASRVGGVCWDGRLPSSQCSVNPSVDFVKSSRCFAGRSSLSSWFAWWGSYCLIVCKDCWSIF